MFSGAVFVEYRNTCYNLTHETSCLKYVKTSQTFIAFSMIALVMNTFSLYIFLRQKRQSVMRTSLICLSISEIIYHFWTNVSYINIVAGLCHYNSEPQRVWQVVLGGIAVEMADMFLVARNWCNVLITMSRIEVVLCPMKTNRFFKRRSIKSLYMLVISVTIPLVLVRMTIEHLVVCTNPYPWMMLEYRYSEKVINLLGDYFDVYVFFMLQTIIPVASVLIMSIIIAVQISPWKEASITANDARRRRQMRATKTVLGLAVIFSILEMPTFVLIFIHRITPKFNVQLATSVAEFLILLDSILNIIVYMSGMPDFRKQLTTCCRQSNQPARSMPSGGYCRTIYVRTNHENRFNASNCDIALSRRQMLT